MMIERANLGQVMTSTLQVCTTPQCQADMAAANATPTQVPSCPPGFLPANNGTSWSCQTTNQTLAAIQNNMPVVLIGGGIALAIALMAPGPLKLAAIIPAGYVALVVGANSGGF